MATDNVSREPAAILTAIESFLVAPPINVSGSVHQPTDTDTDTDVTALLPLAFVYDGTLVQDRIAPHLVTYLAKGVDIASELGPGSTASTIFQAGLRTAGLLTTAQGYNDLDGNRGGQWCDHGPMQHPEEDDDNDHNDDDDDDISNDDDSDDDSSYISSNGAVEGEPGLSDALSNLLFRPLENLTQSPMPRNRNIAHRKVKLCALGSAGRPDWYIQIKNRRRVLIELMTEWVARREYFDGIVAMVATGQVTWHPASREVVYAGSEMHNLGVWAVVRLLLKQVYCEFAQNREAPWLLLTTYEHSIVFHRDDTAIHTSHVVERDGTSTPEEPCKSTTTLLLGLWVLPAREYVPQEMADQGRPCRVARRVGGADRPPALPRLGGQQMQGQGLGGDYTGDRGGSDAGHMAGRAVETAVGSERGQDSGAPSPLGANPSMSTPIRHRPAPLVLHSDSSPESDVTLARKYAPGWGREAGDNTPNTTPEVVLATDEQMLGSTRLVLSTVKHYGALRELCDTFLLGPIVPSILATSALGPVVPLLSASALRLSAEGSAAEQTGAPVMMSSQSGSLPITDLTLVIGKRLGAGATWKVYATDGFPDVVIRYTTLGQFSNGRTKLTRTHIRAAIAQEMLVYERLADAGLQGQVAPILHGVWAGTNDVVGPGATATGAGDKWVMLLENVGDRVRVDQLSREQRLAILAGYLELHAVGILHRDTSPRNWCVDPGGKVTIVDFGLGMLFDPDDTLWGHARNNELWAVAGELNLGLGDVDDCKARLVTRIR